MLISLAVFFLDFELNVPGWEFCFALKDRLVLSSCVLGMVRSHSKPSRGNKKKAAPAFIFKVVRSGRFLELDQCCWEFHFTITAD